MEKIKLTIMNFIESDKGKDIMVVIIIILVGLGSFGLGRLSKDSSNEGIKIDYGNQEANAISSLNQNTNTSQNTQKSISGNFFASSKGSKYYSTSCNAGKTIKQENRVYFDTSEEAESAGFELSSSCR
ncbi:MAG: Ada metal-binding domain-containing protein [Candidatus Paceibacterota bacterium]